MCKWLGSCHILTTSCKWLSTLVTPYSRSGKKDPLWFFIIKFKFLFEATEFLFCGCLKMNPLTCLYCGLCCQFPCSPCFFFLMLPPSLYWTAMGKRMTIKTNKCMKLKSVLHHFLVLSFPKGAIYVLWAALTGFSICQFQEERLGFLQPVQYVSVTNTKGREPFPLLSLLEFFHKSLDRHSASFLCYYAAHPVAVPVNSDLTIKWAERGKMGIWISLGQRPTQSGRLKCHFGLSDFQPILIPIDKGNWKLV